MPAAPSQGSSSPRELVEDIAKGLGYVREEALARLRAAAPEDAQHVEEAMEGLRGLVASSVATLARNLYTSSARFVFELLQNADDNRYTKNRQDQEEPYICFEVFTNKIIVECNEDGFTPENLRAICAIGKSSKTGTHGYIGEKGIGFKSVFMAAWKVHIQSNGYSFAFVHRQGDAGLGMITPLWNDSGEPMECPVTRMTLYLHEGNGRVAGNRSRDLIIQQFRDLQATTLLFLKNLKEITVNIYDEQNELLPELSYSCEIAGGDPETIWKSWGNGDEEVSSYYVAKHLVRGLPKREGGTIPGVELQHDQQDTPTEIVLAFPVTEDLVPMVESQDIFAFLPIRNMGFKFLIQADFVTQANRQDIVTTSLRNEALRTGIADCFIHAIETFCTDSDLQYKWMRWLPQRDSYPWDAFWDKLLTEIEAKLESARVLKTRTSGSLVQISSLRQHPHRIWLDQHGEPLWNDIEPEKYPAKEYEASDLELLSQYGLGKLTWYEYIDRVEADISSKPSESRLRHLRPEECWHTQAAHCLIELYQVVQKNTGPDFISRFRSLPLIPVGLFSEWKSPEEMSSFYYPHCEGVGIPFYLGFHLVEATAAKNRKRRALFDLLGAKVAPLGEVRNRILDVAALYPLQRQNDGGRFLLSQSVESVRFMYVTHALGEDEEEEASRWPMYLMYDEEETLRNPHDETLYLRTDDEYGAAKLFEPGEDDSSRFPVRFIHPKYMDDAPLRTRTLQLSWAQWLRKFLGVSSSIRILSSPQGGPPDLSDGFRYIAEHRKERFLGALAHYFDQEEEEILRSVGVLQELRNVKVRCKHGGTDVLCSTYLPLPELEEQVDRLAGGSPFSFVDLGESIGAGSYQRRWGFLVDHLGVRYREDETFFMRVLDSVISTVPNAEDVVHPERMVDIYEAIINHRQLGTSAKDIGQIIRRSYHEKAVIYVPSVDDTRPATWAQATQCRWGAPAGFQSKFPLQHLYRTAFGLDNTRLAAVETFFRGLQETESAQWTGYLDELKHLRTVGCLDIDWITEVYSRLQKFESVKFYRAGKMPSRLNPVKSAFLENRLVYFPSSSEGTWHTVKDCLWTSGTKIRGKVALKNIIWAMNGLLNTTGDTPPASEVRLRTVIPVRDVGGQVTLERPHATFGIVDRKLLGDAFKGKAKLMDFTMDEVRRLQPFLDWLNLGSHLLSALVTERSRVDEKDMRRLQSPDRGLRRKAHALLRVATQFNSPRVGEFPERLYDILFDAEVYETDGISSELHLIQDGVDMMHVLETSEVHIAEDKDGLKIYVPRDKKRQAQCYISRLPRRLAEWLVTEPSADSTPPIDAKAIHITTQILNAHPQLINLCDILDAEGVVDVDVPDKACNEELGPKISLPIQPSSSPLGHAVTSLPKDEVFGTGAGAANKSLVQRMPETRAGRLDLQQVPRNKSLDLEMSYDVHHRTRLVDNAINAARRYSIPDMRVVEVSTSNMRSPIPASYRVTSGSPQTMAMRAPSEHNLNIGAAGELFVFETLSKELPGLIDVNNWQSNIRGLASTHPRHGNLSSWTGHETADIVYNDSSGRLTALLISKSYLDSTNWTGKCPNYLIEVKSTTGSVGAPFYVSRNQYQKIQEHSNYETDPPTIYLIARVFNVDKPEIGMVLYPNPEDLRQQGLLAFTPETWSVVPGPRGA